jgi:predicted enzyme related to lactoylglutathione lyase
VSDVEACPVTHFEIYGVDPAKLAEFYRAVLGWRLEKAPGVDYWRIPAGEPGAGGLGGGVTYRPEMAPNGWLTYIRVPSVDAAIDEACRLGGALIRPKTAVPKTAWYAMLSDPEGNVFSIWEPDPTAFPDLVPE